MGTSKGVALSAEDKTQRQAELLRRDPAAPSSNPVQHQNRQDLGEPRTAGANPVTLPQRKLRADISDNPLASWIPKKGGTAALPPLPALPPGFLVTKIPEGVSSAQGFEVKTVPARAQPPQAFSVHEAMAQQDYSGERSYVV